MKNFLIFLVLISSFVFAGCNNDSKNKLESKNSVIKDESENKENSSQLTPEEVIARMDIEEGVGVEQGPISVEITSPERKGFSPGQAQLYKAEVLGLETGSKIRCKWRFYLNQYDEEVLYEEMDDKRYSGDLCSFTESFIRDRGDLRVQVEVEVFRNGQEEVVENALAERLYRVE